MKELVVKSNELNATTIYNDSIQLKIFSKIITLIHKEPIAESYGFDIKDLMYDFGGSQENYHYIKKVAKSMMIVDLGDGKKNINLSVVFDNIRINESGKITFFVYEKFKPFIVGLANNYTSYYFENIALLKSKFAIRIYEMLKQYQGKNNIGWRKISIDSLREFLAISDNQYKLYGDFKRKVILVAQKELQEKTDIKFTFEEIKERRKVTSIKFLIFGNNKKTNENQTTVEGYIEEKKQKAQELLSENERKLYKKLILNGITNETALEFIKDKNILNSVINSNIDYVNELDQSGNYNFTAGKTNFLVASIRENYSGNSRIKKNHFKKMADKIEAKQIENEIFEKQKLKENRKKTNEWFNSLDEEEQNRLIEQYKTGSPIQDKEKLIKSRIFGAYLKGEIK